MINERYFKLDQDNHLLINFGKYKGTKLWDILSHDPKYIHWCLHNLTDFKLTEQQHKYWRKNYIDCLYNESRRKSNAAYWKRLKDGLPSTGYAAHEMM